jgi:hypothetical protein
MSSGDRVTFAKDYPIIQAIPPFCLLKIAEVQAEDTFNYIPIQKCGGPGTMGAGAGAIRAGVIAGAPPASEGLPHTTFASKGATL